MLYIFPLSTALCLFSRENPARLYQEREMLIYAGENKREGRKRK